MSHLSIGSRRELFIDDTLIDTLSGGATQRLHRPTPRELVLRPTEPWEQAIGYLTVFRDGDRYRLYYKAGVMKSMPEEKDQRYGSDDCLVCYAESSDGIHWEKPTLGLFPFGNQQDTNIVWKGRGSHGFAPFIDANPDCPPEQRYKAVGRSRIDLPDNPPNERHYRALYALTSPDGIHWTVQEGPRKFGAILDRDEGYFDSQNVAFWDPKISRYRVFVRKKRPAPERQELLHVDDGDGGINKIPLVRDIATTTSGDFLDWPQPAFLEYGEDTPAEELYTNNIQPYYRAPHILLGFPTRYVENRGLLTPLHRQLAEDRPGRFHASYTDALFMSSRDGRHFRRWEEAFLVPGQPETTRWSYGSCYLNWGIVETVPDDIPDAPPAMTFYVPEGNLHGTGRDIETGRGIRRHTLRPDGFVSIHTTRQGGDLLTRPFTFSGRALRLNFQTSAAGSLRVEIQQADGSPIAGFSLGECEILYGNDLDRQVNWQSGADLQKLAGQPIRLRIQMQEADLYALRFATTTPAKTR